MRTLAPTASIRRRQSLLLGANLLLEGRASIATVRFFVTAYPIFLEVEIATQRAMAEKSGCSSPGAKRHIDILTDLGYLIRVHYRGWRLSTGRLDDLSTGGGL